jgi:exopolysaccharide production protein ExoQ
MIGEMSQGMHSRISERNQFRSNDPRRNRGVPRAILSGPTPKAIIDKFSLLPILACVYALIVSHLLIFFTRSNGLESQIAAADARWDSRLFWPAMSAISILLALQNRSRLVLPPNLKCLVAYLAFAGASVLWALSPDHSFMRYLQQLMIVTSIVLPVMLSSRTVDMMRAVFLCFALALIVNLYFVSQGSVDMAMYSQGLVNIGYEGYFNGKNYLGECAAPALLLSLHEILQRGWGRRVFGATMAVIAVALLLLSQSKTAFGLALVCPILAWLTLLARKATRLSPAIILLAIPFCWIVASHVSNFGFPRLSYILYHDSSLSGRIVIWDFTESEIARSPLLGWGYLSFWLVPNSPAYTEAPGWVKMMPNSHNGYYDTMLETGYIGLAFLLVFILATLHAVGRVADRDPGRARLLLSLAIFSILYNFFESIWMRSFEFLWVLFVIVAAEIGRYWGPFPLRGAARSSSVGRVGALAPSPAARAPRPNIGLP